MKRLLKFKNKKAQTTLETCLFIAIFVAAGLAMQGYLRRAIQGNWRGNIDSFSDEQYGRLSKENVSPLKFIGSQMTAKEISDDKVLEKYNLTSGSGTIRIKGWGTYEK